MGLLMGYDVHQRLTFIILINLVLCGYSLALNEAYNVSIQCYDCSISPMEPTQSLRCTNVKDCDVENYGLGCIISEHYDGSASHLLHVEQRCLTLRDLSDWWNLRDAVEKYWGNLTNSRDVSMHDRVSGRPSNTRKKLSDECNYMENLRNGEIMEICYCRESLCNIDIITAGGVGKGKYNSSAVVASKTSVVLIFGGFMLTFMWHLLDKI